MNIKQIGIALVVIFFIAIAIFAQTLIKIEQRSQMQDILQRGNYLVSLIALHPIKDFYGNRNDLFLKTLAEQISSDGLVYCFVHDQAGNPLVSFVSRDVVSQIPPEVQTRSLYVNGLTQQTFKINGTKNTINEFAKPIFEDGQRSGTVRLGFNLPSPASPF